MYSLDKFNQDPTHEANKYSQPIKKKYKYDHLGVPFEPFHMGKKDLDNKIEDDSWDPWLESVKPQMLKMDLQQCNTLAKSDDEEKNDSSSEDNPADIKIEIAQRKKEDEEQRQLIKERPSIKLQLITRLIELLDDGILCN